MSFKTTADIRTLQAEMAALKARVDKLEAAKRPGRPTKEKKAANG